MSVQSTVSPPSSLATREFDTADRDVARARAHSRRVVLVQFLRVALAVFIVGAWEIGARYGVECR